VEPAGAHADGPRKAAGDHPRRGSTRVAEANLDVIEEEVTIHDNTLQI
jgi:hypothetical protein